MYNSHFGFRDKPFNVTPDPRFFYPNSTYDEAYANLLYGIRERKGFIVLTGEVGTGKTTLLRRLMSELEPAVQGVLLYHTSLSFEELLVSICEELGLQPPAEGQLYRIQALNDFLISQLKAGRTTALLIDEAQTLKTEVLEQLRLLSNLETASEKLLQIVLAGQPELEAKLDHSHLRQLKQRVAVWSRLTRLSSAEVGAFIDYRLRAVGYQGCDIFVPDAIQRIAVYSKGIPRLVNVMCDNALLVAYAAGQREIGAGIIEEVAGDLRLKGEDRPGRTWSLDERAHEEGAESEALRQLREKKSQRKIRLRVPRWAGAALVLLVLAAVAVSVAPRNIPESMKGQLLGLNVWMGELSGRFWDRVKSLRPGFMSAGQDNSSTPLSFAGELSAAWDASRLYEETPSLPGKSRPSELAAVQQESWPRSDAARSLTVDDDEAPSQSVRAGAGACEASQDAGETDQAPANLNTAGRWVVISAGDNILGLVSKVYGNTSPLVLDLIKELNPAIADLNDVRVSQRVWFPSVTREALLRRQPDGCYRLILASYHNKQEAETLAGAIRLRYAAVVAPKGIAEGFRLHRVEVVGLRSRAEADQAWELANPGRFFSIPKGGSILEVVSTAYGDLNPIYLDLIREFNPQVDNLNKVREGEKIWLLPVTPDSLSQRQPDGTYRLTVAAFGSLTKARGYAQKMRKRGYEVTLSSRHVSDTLVLHRAEIAGLKTGSEVRNILNLDIVRDVLFNATVQAEGAGEERKPGMRIHPEEVNEAKL